MTRALPLIIVLALAGCGGSAAPASDSTASETYGGETAAEPAAMDGGGADSMGEARPATTRTSVNGAEPGIAEPVPQPAQPMHPAMGSGGGIYDDLLAADRELQNTMSLANVDCGSARQYRDRICDLSERICDIASDNPGDAPTGERCRDGAARCENASDRVDRTCP